MSLYNDDGTDAVRYDEARAAADAAADREAGATDPDWRTPPKGDKPVPPEIDVSKFLVDHVATLDLDLTGIDRLRPPHVIDGFIRQGGVMLLGAESKSRKSWLAQDAAFSVVAGEPWLPDIDGTGYPVARAAAHVFDLELDKGEIEYRFARTRLARFVSRERRAEVTHGFRHYCLDGLPPLDALAVIEAALPTIAPGDLVVVDCFYPLQPDGNEPAEVSNLIRKFKLWAKETQAAWVIVDHFRKGAADKARDRFAGSFIKQAGPGTLVAVEVRKDGILELQIDARSFHGDPKAWVRWEPHLYRFVSVAPAEIEAAAAGAEMSEFYGWLAGVWRTRDFGCPVTASEAAHKWSVTPQTARDRLRKLDRAGYVELVAGKPMQAYLTDAGRRMIECKTEGAK